MKLVHLNGKAYRVSYDDSVEVRIKRGEPRVMREARAESWRTLKPGKTRDRVLGRAAWLYRNDRLIEGEK